MQLENVEMAGLWNIKPLPLPNAREYLEDLNDLRFSDSGMLAEVNPFFFVNEACQLLACLNSDILTVPFILSGRL